jgi:hypothetical protein
VRRVDHPPAGLRGLDQLVGHGDTGDAGTGPLLTLLRKRTVAKMNSIGDRSWVLRGVVDFERLDRDLARSMSSGVDDLPHRRERA